MRCIGEAGVGGEIVRDVEAMRVSRREWVRGRGE